MSGITIVNDGGMFLPFGAECFIPSTPSINFEPTHFTIPEILSGSSYVVPVTYYGRIFDEPPPNRPGPFVSKAEFTTRIDLLGRPFERSFMTQVLEVQYPIKLAYMKCPETLGPGEVGTFEIGIQNISRLPYGGHEGSGGKVVLQVHFDQRIVPVATANVGLSPVPYTVTHDPTVRDSTYIQMHEIPPGQTVNVNVIVQMDSQAELFDHCLWQVDVYLRGKLIEYNFQKIRISPIYAPSDPAADVLMVTGSSISRREFVFWQHILDGLNVSVDFWDTGHYHGFSATNARHEVTWEGRYSGKMILFPHADLQMLHGIDIVHHFHGSDFQDDVSLSDVDSSMVLFMPPQGHQPSTFNDKGDLVMIRHLSLVNAPVHINYTGIHFSTPDTVPSLFDSCEKKIMKQLQKYEPQQVHNVLSRQINIEQTGVLRYRYGTVDLRRCPLLRSCKLLYIDGYVGAKTAMGHDDQHLSLNTMSVPLGSNFGQVYLATLYGLPMKNKLALLRPPPEDASPAASFNLSFTLPNGLSLNKHEVIAVCMAKEIADEVLNCSGQARRIEFVLQEISGNTAVYVNNGEVIVQAMMLVKAELKLRKKKLNHRLCSQSCERVTRVCDEITDMLYPAGARDEQYQHIAILPRYEVLMDSHHFHFSHQHIH